MLCEAMERITAKGLFCDITYHKKLAVAANIKLNFKTALNKKPQHCCYGFF